MRTPSWLTIAATLCRSSKRENLVDIACRWSYCSKLKVEAIQHPMSAPCHFIICRWARFLLKNWIRNRLIWSSQHLRSYFASTSAHLSRASISESNNVSTRPHPTRAGASQRHAATGTLGLSHHIYHYKQPCHRRKALGDMDVCDEPLAGAGWRRSDLSEWSQSYPTLLPITTCLILTSSIVEQVFVNVIIANLMVATHYGLGLHIYAVNYHDPNSPHKVSKTFMVNEPLSLIHV